MLCLGLVLDVPESITNQPFVNVVTMAPHLLLGSPERKESPTWIPAPIDPVKDRKRLKLGAVIAAADIVAMVLLLERLKDVLKPKAFEHAIEAAVNSMIAAGAVFWAAKRMKSGDGACLLASSFALPIVWVLIIAYIAIRSL